MVKLFGNNGGLSIWEVIERRKRSSNPVCWNCKEYPDCGLCQHRGDLRHPPKSTALSDELREAVMIICKLCDEYGQFMPNGGRVRPEVLVQLEQLGVIVCVKRGSNYTRSCYVLNLEYSAEVKLFFKRYHARR